MLKTPINNPYYEFVGEPNLVIEENSNITEVKNNKNKSFHADTYIFDSKSEKNLFLQAIDDNIVKECYFTGMFTNEKTGFAVPYIDPETNTLRNYYPDFVIKRNDGSYLIVEVKADFQVDNIVVKAKADAAREMIAKDFMEYRLIPSTKIDKERINFN